jgi:2'-5' RNA ligase
MSNIPAPELQSQPIYIMAKPPSTPRRQIEQLRRTLDIDNRYGAEKLHSTLLPLGDGRDLPQTSFERIRIAVESLCAEPFDVAFDRVQGNALVGGRALAGLRSFQNSLAQRLRAFGLLIPEYDFHPHISLTYGQYRERNISLPPIRWTVDEILLVRSIHGRGRHEVLHRWSLVSWQGSFGF